MFRVVVRALVALLGAGVGAVVVALFETRGVIRTLAAAGETPPKWGALFSIELGLLVPVALAVGFGVAVLAQIVEPVGAPTVMGRLRALRTGSPAARVSAATAAPLTVLAILSWAVGSAHLARALLAEGAAPASGLSVGTAAVGLAMVFGLAALAMLPTVRSALAALGGGTRGVVDPFVTGGAALVVATLIIVVGIRTGDASGIGGALGVGIFGVLRRPELDLRPVGCLAILALAAFFAPKLAALRSSSSNSNADARGARVVVAVVAAGSIFALVGLTVRASRSVDDVVLSGIARLAPTGGVSLAVLRRATDRDGDGHSARFGGGDCNDRDRQVNPAAIDVPGNGIDEDCSGADTPAFDDTAASEDQARVAAAAPAKIARPNRTYNVVLITVDTLRHDLGFAGYPKPVSPNIDALAAKASVFERAYSLGSYTAKSLGPLLIGRYPSETLRDWEHFTTYSRDNTFVAERLRDAGARTFAGMCHYYFKWNTGYSQGFDVFDTSALPSGMSDNDSSITSDRMSDLAIALLSRPENVAAKTSDGSPRRFFTWFHYFDPHAQYVTHAGAPEFAKMEGGQPGRSVYDQEVWFTDKHIGRVIDHIASQPFGEDTAIIITADHGESFGDHGMRTHGRELWESLVRVPLVIYVPGAEPRRVPVKRSHIDLVPTILDLVGAPKPTAEGAIRGTSLAEDIFAARGAELQERDVYIDMPEGPYNEVRRALITGPSPGMKLIHFGARRYQLFDLAADPGETVDLSRTDDFARVMGRMDRLRGGLREIAVTGVIIRR